MALLYPHYPYNLANPHMWRQFVCAPPTGPPIGESTTSMFHEISIFHPQVLWYTPMEDQHLRLINYFYCPCSLLQGVKLPEGIDFPNCLGIAKVDMMRPIQFWQFRARFRGTIWMDCPLPKSHECGPASNFSTSETADKVDGCSFLWVDGWWLMVVCYFLWV